MRNLSEGVVQLSHPRRRAKNHSGLAGGKKRSFFTIGYQFHNVPSFRYALLKKEIDVLIDVRQNPISRKPGFSKGQLSIHLQSWGIEYLHYPCLGTPPRIRKVLRETGSIELALTKYERHLQSKEKCLKSLLKTVGRKIFCLVCLESRYTACHRGVIAEKLSEMTGCQAIHLN